MESEIAKNAPYHLCNEKKHYMVLLLKKLSKLWQDLINNSDHRLGSCLKDKIKDLEECLLPIYQRRIILMHIGEKHIYIIAMPG